MIRNTGAVHVDECDSCDQDARRKAAVAASEAAVVAAAEKQAWLDGMVSSPYPPGMSTEHGEAVLVSAAFGETYRAALLMLDADSPVRQAMVTISRKLLPPAAEHDARRMTGESPRAAVQRHGVADALVASLMPMVAAALPPALAAGPGVLLGEAVQPAPAPARADWRVKGPLDLATFANEKGNLVGQNGVTHWAGQTVAAVADSVVRSGDPELMGRALAAVDALRKQLDEVDERLVGAAWDATTSQALSPGDLAARKEWDALVAEVRPEGGRGAAA